MIVLSFLVHRPYSFQLKPEQNDGKMIKDLQHPLEPSSEKTYGPGRYRKLNNGERNRYRGGEDLTDTCLVFQTLTSEEGQTIFFIELYFYFILFFLFTVSRIVVS
jgi:hypothetical protein